MSSFGLKLIGIITMLLDHIGYAFFDDSILRVIGRIAFPIFAFQLVIGFEHTKDIKKHLLKLLFFAFISQLPYYFFRSINSNGFYLNIMFTLLLALITIILFNKFEKKLDGFILVFLMCILAEVLNVSYGWFGICLVFIFYYFKDSKIKKSIAFIVLCLIYYILYIIFDDTIYYLFLLFGTILALIPILLYNNKEGKKLSNLFYWFYPVHMMVIYLFYIIIKG